MLGVQRFLLIVITIGEDTMSVLRFPGRADDYKIVWIILLPWKVVLIHSAASGANWHLKSMSSMAHFYKIRDKESSLQFSWFFFLFFCWHYWRQKDRILSLVNLKEKKKINLWSNVFRRWMYSTNLIKYSKIWEKSQRDIIRCGELERD